MPLTPEAAKALADAGVVAILLLILGSGAWIVFRVVKELWRDHLSADHDDRAQRDRALDLLETSLQANRDHAKASADMANAWNERNKADAARRRRMDPK